jgi:hypothetical protein
VADLRCSIFFQTPRKQFELDRFIDKRFGVTPTYLELPDSVLGFTTFGETDLEDVVILCGLDEEGNRGNASGG